jgi:hypothetical protein
MFRRTVLLLGTMIGLGATQARADDWGFYYGRPSPHRVLHGNLNANEYQRQVDHAIAHQGPLTYGEHYRLHRSLDQERFVDEARHRNAYRIYGCGYYGWYYTRSYPSGVYLGNRRTQIYVGW